MHRIRRRYRRLNGRFIASAVAAGLLLAAAHGHVPPASGQTASMVQPGTATPSPAAAAAIAYARAQLGKPYVWGGTGPDAFDCSGLIQAAWPGGRRDDPPDLGRSVGGPAARIQPAARRPGVLSRERRDVGGARPCRAGDRRRPDDPGVRHRHSDRGFPAQRGWCGRDRRLRPPGRCVVKRGLVAGTVVSLIVAGAWSVCGGGDDGPGPAAAPVRHHPVASYLALAAAPTGNGAELFAVVAVIYAVCLFPAARRRARARGTGDGQA